MKPSIQKKFTNQRGAAMLGIVLIIVVILIALVGALSIGPQLQKITTERQTVKRANVIVDAVRQYYLARGRLPEPSSVPVVDLNLEQQYKLDSWGQEWTYFRAVAGGNPDTDSPHIAKLKYNDLLIAGVLISGGPDQKIQTDDPKWNSVDALWEVSKAIGSDDIIIPINVQGEAIQKTNDALTVLANRTEESGVCPPDYSVFGDFLAQLGLGTSTYAEDPWDAAYTWGGGTLSRFISTGSPDGQIRSREINCVSSPPPGTPLTHIDFSVGFEEDMTPEEIVAAHPAIAEAGDGAKIDTDNGETVLYLDGDVNSWVRLNDLITDPVDFCEYTIMGWFKTYTEATDSFGPIINRETSWTNRNFWVTLWKWNEDYTDYDQSPIVQRASSDGNQYAFDIGVGDGENLFRDKEWHFFAVNMEASENSIEENDGTCTISSGNFNCSLFASSSACSAEDVQYGNGPDVGENVNDLPIYIGYSDTGLARHFHGYIREIAIYSRRDGILAEGEIQNWHGRSAWMPQPVAEYRFDEEITGEVRDSSVNDNHGTAEGGATTVENGVIGRAGTFIANESQYIDIPHSSSLEMSDGDQVTVAGWINQTSIQTGWRAILTKSNTSYALQLQNGNMPIFTIYDTTWRSVNANSGIVQDQWYHIVGTFDGSTVRIYVDGILQDHEESANYINSTEDPVFIADNSGSSGRYFDGLLDEFKIYNVALTPEQVCALYQKENACLQHDVCER